MGVYSRIKRLLKALPHQADAPVFKGEPQDAIAAIEEARQQLWDLQRETSDIDMTEIVLAFDKLLRKEQARWKSTKTCPLCGWALSPNANTIWPLNCINPDCKYKLNRPRGGSEGSKG